MEDFFKGKFDLKVHSFDTLNPDITKPLYLVGLVETTSFFNLTMLNRFSNATITKTFNFKKDNLLSGSFVLEGDNEFEIFKLSLMPFPGASNGFYTSVVTSNIDGYQVVLQFSILSNDQFILSIFPTSEKNVGGESNVDINEVIVFITDLITQNSTISSDEQDAVSESRKGFTIFGKRELQQQQQSLLTTFLPLAFFWGLPRLMKMFQKPGQPVPPGQGGSPGGVRGGAGGAAGSGGGSKGKVAKTQPLEKSHVEELPDDVEEDDEGEGEDEGDGEDDDGEKVD